MDKDGREGEACDCLFFGKRTLDLARPFGDLLITPFGVDGATLVVDVIFLQ